MNIHRFGKIFTLARSARPGLASRMNGTLLPTLAALALVPALGAQAPTAGSNPTPPRPFSLDDVLCARAAREPQISPDGAWVAYAVSTADTAEDRNKSAVWMASWDGARNVRLTTSKPGEDAPRWSPDGRWLAFLSSPRPSGLQRGASSPGFDVVSRTLRAPSQLAIHTALLFRSSAVSAVETV